MPTPLPSSFASAAAGNTHDPSRRGDGSAAGDWYATVPCCPLHVPSHLPSCLSPPYLLAVVKEPNRSGLAVVQSPNAVVVSWC